MDSLYLDHNATTPMHPEVAEAMARCFASEVANPASQHRPGQQAARRLRDAREAIAGLLGADLGAAEPDRLIFTSGGTEANNLALLGIAPAVEGPEPGHVVISAIEHSCVIGAAEHLMDQGWQVDALGVTPQGVVCTERLPSLLTPRTRLLSVLLANHEIGTLQPVARLTDIARQAGVPVHTDAVQMAGKLPVDFRALGVSAMTVTAHKFQGPLGIGALLVGHGVPIRPVLFGGHQQDGLRPGTESVALAVGMQTALEVWRRDGEAAAQRMASLRDRFEDSLRDAWPELVVHGCEVPRLPNTSNVAFPGLDAQVLFTALDVSGVACSVGSACASGSSELSPTLLALGLPKDVVRGSLRFSLGADTTQAEIEEAVRRIVEVGRQLSV